MSTALSFPALIGDIYDTALDLNRWQDTLIRIRDYVGGCSAVVYTKSITGSATIHHYGDSYITPHFRALYTREFVKSDPTTVAQFLARPGVPVAINDLMPYDEFLRSRIYFEWARPQELVDHAVVILDRDSAQLTLAAVFRDQRQGVVTRQARRRMEMLGPHLRRAMSIGRALDFSQARQDSLCETLDALRTGVILIDANGHIVHTNRAAEALLALAPGVRKAQGRLVLQDGAADRRLRAVVSAATRPGLEAQAGSLALPVAALNGVPHVLHALPLTAGNRYSFGRETEAVAALFVRKAELDLTNAPRTLAQVFGLTPAEVRVLLAVIEGGGVAEAAETLGSAQATVKTHLHRLFAKTGTARQADLVRLVAAYSSPVET